MTRDGGEVRASWSLVFLVQSVDWAGGEGCRSVTLSDGAGPGRDRREADAAQSSSSRSERPEPEIAVAAERIEVLPALVLPVARVGHLIALKLLAVDDRTRPQDAVDLRALIEVAELEDLETARQAVRLIEERGYHRGRNLVAALDDLVK